MGEIAEDIIDGLFCETCGAIIDGTAPGYPRKCEACEDDSVDFPWAMRIIKEGIEQIQIGGTKKQKKSLIGFLYKKVREIKNGTKGEQQ